MVVGVRRNTESDSPLSAALAELMEALVAREIWLLSVVEVAVLNVLSVLENLSEQMNAATRIRTDSEKERARKEKHKHSSTHRSFQCL